jgi:hypothetical protein
VLEARYGVEGGRVRAGGRRKSSLWKEIVSIREGGEHECRWFEEHVTRRVGDMSYTFFWTDPWVDSIPLCVQFGRLYDLAETKEVTVAEMSLLRWGSEGEACVWQRQFSYSWHLTYCSSYVCLRVQ